MKEPEQLDLFAKPAADAKDSPSGAVFSANGLHRYRLWRQWNPHEKPVGFIMLNPSTADATDDDPTIRRCTAFARAWGRGGIVVVNLYALRTPDPDELAKALKLLDVDVVGGQNDAHICSALAACDVIVCAWGSHKSASEERITKVLALLPKGAEVACLGTTKAGQPKHPLYLPANAARVPFSPRNDWPSVGITSAGGWGSHDGLAWEKSDAPTVGGHGGFLMGYWVTTPAAARRAMIDGAKGAAAPRR